MQTIIIIGMAIMFAAFLAVFQTFYWAYVAKAEREQMERLRRLNVLGDATEQESLLKDRARDAASAALGDLGLHFQSTIDAADLKMNVGNLLGQMAAAAMFGLLAGYFLLGIGAIIVAVIGFFAPYIRLRMMGAARAKKLVEQLPEALDLMARSLQAGLGLNEAFRTCAEEMPLPIATEFGRVFEEVRFGREYRDALNTLIRRNPGIFDLRLFVSSVLLQRETGGNLIEILEAISSTIRGRFMFHAKVKAMTSEARFSGLILGSLPLAVGAMVTLVNPAYLMPLIEDPLGNFFLGLGVCMYSTGGYLMYAVSQVEV